MDIRRALCRQCFDTTDKVAEEHFSTQNGALIRFVAIPECLICRKCVRLIQASTGYVTCVAEHVLNP